MQKHLKHYLSLSDSLSLKHFFLSYTLLITIQNFY